MPKAKSMTGLSGRMKALRNSIVFGIVVENMRAAAKFQNTSDENRMIASEIRKFLPHSWMGNCSCRPGKHQLTEADEKLLRKLKPPEFSSFDVSRSCLLGTRESLIKGIIKWCKSTDSSSPQLYWLYGVAGCGKSSVATSVASAMKTQAILSYSFFCKRDDPERRRPIRLIHSLIYYLARAVEEYSNCLLQELRKDADIVDQPLQNQFDALLVGPLKELSSFKPPVPLIIIIDALDESDQSDVISSYLSRTVELATWIKFFITSRPLPEIEQRIMLHPSQVSSHDLYTISAEEDILAYTEEEYKNPRGKLATLRDEGINSDAIDKLARKAQGLFIWITVVCSYISQLKAGRVKEFWRIVHSEHVESSEKQLDKLYLQVVDRAIGSEDIPANKMVIQLFLGLVNAISRNKALSAKALFELRPSEYEGTWGEWKTMIDELGSVLIIDTKTGVIRACHKSFLDFLGEKARSGEYWTDPEKLNKAVVEKCLEVMHNQLKFNICGLGTDLILNEDIPDRWKVVNAHISEELWYSCEFWTEHLSRCESLSSTMVPSAEELVCSTKILFWLEAMSLLDLVRRSEPILGECARIFAVSNSHYICQKKIRK